MNSPQIQHIYPRLKVGVIPRHLSDRNLIRVKTLISRKRVNSSKKQ